VLKSVVIYTVLAICCLAVNASFLKAEDRTYDGKARVKAESAIVFSSVSPGSRAVKFLKMGEIVIIDFEIGGPEGRWCGVLEPGMTDIAGYMECKYLERDDPGKMSWRELGSPGAEKGWKTTKVIIEGNVVLVPAKIGYGESSIEVMLVLDTGASHTIINTAIADRLNIDPAKTKKVQVQVVGGALVDIRIAKLSYLSVDPHTRNDLVVGIVEDKSALVRYDGLLGMDFLKNLKYYVDFDNMLIRWN
jgi:predicted aspartyl protease